MRGLVKKSQEMLNMCWKFRPACFFVVDLWLQVSKTRMTKQKQEHDTKHDNGTTNKEKKTTHIKTNEKTRNHNTKTKNMEMKQNNTKTQENKDKHENNNKHTKKHDIIHKDTKHNRKVQENIDEYTSSKIICKISILVQARPHSTWERIGTHYHVCWRLCLRTVRTSPGAASRCCCAKQ